jgi:hypothetical protein
MVTVFQYSKYFMVRRFGLSLVLDAYRLAVVVMIVEKFVAKLDFCKRHLRLVGR